MQEKLEAKPAFAAIKQNMDSPLLLELICGVSFKFDDQKCLFSSVCFVMKQFYNLNQNTDVSNGDFHKRLDNAVTVVKSHKGKLGHDETFQGLTALEQASSANRKAVLLRKQISSNIS